jgi:transcriptional regulator with XRE-family HTH domain
MAPLDGVGKALREARTSRGMSLSEVAHAAGVSTATLSRIETEKQSLDVSLLAAVSRILNVAPGQVLGSEPDPAATEEALVASLSTLSPERRVRVLTAAAKRHGTRRSKDGIQAQLDALLATIDVIREEITEIRQQNKRRR